ncbi:hypothetical protein C6341_g27470 [Phytophthora cactorum]|nr:hypothetical protein C6341_g27470 [Phytophthora cactorum]
MRIVQISFLYHWTVVTVLIAARRLLLLYHCRSLLKREKTLSVALLEGESLPTFESYYWLVVVDATHSLVRSMRYGGYC